MSSSLLPSLQHAKIVGPLFGRFGPLKGQKGVQRLENEHFVLHVLLDPFLEDLDP